MHGCCYFEKKSFRQIVRKENQNIKSAFLKYTFKSFSFLSELLGLPHFRADFFIKNFEDRKKTNARQKNKTRLKEYIKI